MVKNSFITHIKQVFINQPYFSLYPISDKTLQEQNTLIEDLNSCDVNEDTEISALLTALYEYAQTKVFHLHQNGESLERNLSYSYKTKKSKVKNKETGEEEVNKETVEKRGTKKIIERYQNLQENNKQSTERYQELMQAFETGSLTREHIPLLDELLKENKYKKWIYKALLISVIAIPILIFVLAKAFHI